MSLHPSKTAHKKILATLSPLQAVGWNRWLSHMAEVFAGLQAQRVSLPKIATDFERTYAALMHQFGPFIDQQAERDPRFLEQLLIDVASVRRLKSGRRVA